MATVSFSSIGKVYGDGTRALAGFSLDVVDGEFMIFVGPSGCGKTTALRMVAGLEDITEGEIRIGDRVVNGLHPRKRDIAMVFQNYALYPHMTVFKNIAFALKVRKMPPAEIRQRVESAAKILGLSDELERKPGQLSGGQRQRVAMGRAIVRDPQVFLMDEPLSNLDAKLRSQMRAEIARIQREVGATTIYVTHDQVEAMTMGDRVAVLRKGELQQVAEPQKLYEHPANLFVASFIGSPEMNLVVAKLEQTDGGLRCEVGKQVLEIPAELARSRPELERYVGRTLGIGVRPEHLEDAALAPAASTRAAPRPRRDDRAAGLRAARPRRDRGHAGADRRSARSVGRRRQHSHHRSRGRSTRPAERLHRPLRPGLTRACRRRRRDCSRPASPPLLRSRHRGSGRMGCTVILNQEVLS